MEPEEQSFYDILDQAQHDERLPEPARRAIATLREADTAFGRWGALVKLGQQPGNLEAAALSVLAYDEELVRVWFLFDANPNDDGAVLVAARAADATRERLRVIG
ncbi:MAG: hypothetical protein HOO96_28600 [Polyangiaceae bacterium]|nr:hypothetical protein [Polyangiaceae bacterium]